MFVVVTHPLLLLGYQTIIVPLRSASARSDEKDRKQVLPKSDDSGGYFWGMGMGDIRQPVQTMRMEIKTLAISTLSYLHL